MRAFDADLADILPLFVAEARGRIETLATHASRFPGDPQAIGALRRELHTLKGASRMLSLSAIASLCHAAESAIEAGSPETPRLLVRVVDALAGMVDAVAAGVEPREDAELLSALSTAPHPTALPPSEPRPPAATPTAPEIRSEEEVIGDVTDLAMELRISASHIGRYPARLDELASLAERGVQEAGPAQVLAVLVASLRREAMALERSQRQLARGAEAQLEALLELQVQPMRRFLLSLARHARELARELGKEVEVDLAGEDTALDRRIVHDLEEAVIHLVRNAVDHGIEDSGVRAREGKQRAGKLRIEAAPAGARVRLTIADDGAGIDTDAVVRAAVERGILPEGSRPTGEEAQRLLLRSGFSTRRSVSELSGRGIGLDVVAAAVARLGGELSISSRQREGTTVVLDIPIARRGERIIVARVGPVRFGIPATSIQRAESLDVREVEQRDGRAFAAKGGRLIPFVPLADVLGVEADERQILLTGLAGGEPVAVAVDAVEGEEEVLVRAAPVLRGASTLLDGVTLLASGEPVAVVCPLALSPRTGVRARGTPAAAASRRRLRILLVEDSFVTREMERRLLEGAGFDVAAAASAAQALDHLERSAFDCIVTDIEMPEMDGLELTRVVRATAHLTTVPVIVVSTRDRHEDRLGALQAGADAYFVKQGLDALELVAVVRRLSGR